jgi:hypothetical protein
MLNPWCDWNIGGGSGGDGGGGGGGGGEEKEDTQGKKPSREEMVRLQDLTMHLSTANYDHTQLP